jgi:4a-hydroxytetrahydrobiopterin dehydratase
MATLLSTDQVAGLAANLPDWQVQAGKLRRELRFPDFVAAFGFMAQVALVAEALGHHPDWSNSWNRVVISLYTHDLGGLSDLDLALAQRINQLQDANPNRGQGGSRQG